MMAASTGGCAAGIRSSPLMAATAAPEGLVYYLPKRNIAVTIVIATDKGDDITVTTAEAMPDVSAGFVATIPRNDAGTVDSTIQVNEKGLLNSDSTTSVTSSLTDIFGKAAGIAGSLPFLESKPKDACVAGTYKRTVEIGDDGTGQDKLCGYSIGVVRSIAPDKSPKGVATANEARRPGLYYRMPIPYRVTIERDGAKREYVAFSPTGSPTFFLPLARSTFATNTATLGFVDGVPTKYKQAIGNEAVALLSIPAAVLENYFTAIGSMFTRKKDLGQKEIDYLNQMNAMAVSEARRASCAKTAAETDDVDVIKKACAN
jgi:hypothetical protein